VGQPITVTVRKGANPQIRFFDCNRSLTGMAIEVYESAADAAGDRPPDVLARRLLGAGAMKVTIYSNVAVVEAHEDSWSVLEDKAKTILEHLFEFYGDNAGWSFEARGVPVVPSPVK